MAGHRHRPHPAGKSKTDLRRGHFTPGHPAAKKPAGRAAPKATSNTEQSLLFDLSHDTATHAPHARPKH
jgi:hypothetical protein